MNISPPGSDSTSGLARSRGRAAASEGKGTQHVGQPPVGQAAASDRAQLSGLSGYLASALAGSPAHLAKMSDLIAAVSGGRYQVDASAVSGSIIQHGIEFGG